MQLNTLNSVIPEDALYGSVLGYVTSWMYTSLQQPNLQCNNGQQHGIHCQCNDGWASSGIDPQDPTVYHWCDRQVVPPPSHGWARPPRALSRAVEATITAVSCKAVGGRVVGLQLYGAIIRRYSTLSMVLFNREGRKGALDSLLFLTRLFSLMVLSSSRW